jgi:hypothetical protein
LSTPLLLFLLQVLCQPEVCGGRAALAGARVTKEQTGVRGRDSRPVFGFSTFLIPGAFAL